MPRETRRRRKHHRPKIFRKLIHTHLVEYLMSDLANIVLEFTVNFRGFRAWIKQDTHHYQARFVGPNIIQTSRNVSVSAVTGLPTVLPFMLTTNGKYISSTALWIEHSEDDTTMYSWPFGKHIHLPRNWSCENILNNEYILVQHETQQGRLFGIYNLQTPMYCMSCCCMGHSFVVTRMLLLLAAGCLPRNGSV